MEPLAALQDALRSHGIDSVVLTGETPFQERARIEADFNTGKVPVVLASAAGQEGINLQRHASMVVHYQVPHNPREMDQREGRVWRMDNPNKGVVLSMPIMADTYEEVFAKSLAQKGANFAALVGVEETAEGGFIERFKIPMESRRSPSLFTPEERSAMLANLKRVLEEAKRRAGASKGSGGGKKKSPPREGGKE